MLYVNKSEGHPPQDELKQVKAVLKRKRRTINYDEAYKEPSTKELLSGLIDHLVDDQRGLCVYCSCRVEGHGHAKPLSKILGEVRDDPVTAHVEHYIPRHLGLWYRGSGSASADILSLDYNNMFAACLGKGSTCDRSRGNRKLHIDPRNWSDVETIFYTSGGEGFSTAGRECSHNETIQHDIDDVLNLNHERLRARRATVQQMLYDMFRGLSDADAVEWCQELLAELRSDVRPPSFAPMLIWMLEDSLDLPHTGMVATEE